MTRDEALRRLEGTWSFDLVGDRALVRDLGLLAAVAAIRGERSDSGVGDRPTVNASGPEGAATPGD